MHTAKMHADEADITTALVRRLVAAQFPRWAHLDVTPVASSGTDNAMFRLGDDMAVRMPRIESAAGNIDRERRWLPELAPHLPVDVPTPLAHGRPGPGYPWVWSVVRWVPGTNPTAPAELGLDLAGFVTALRRIDPTDGPPQHRAVPLRERDAATRDAIRQLDQLDAMADSRTGGRLDGVAGEMVDGAVEGVDGVGSVDGVFGRASGGVVGGAPSGVVDGVVGGASGSVVDGQPGGVVDTVDTAAVAEVWAEAVALPDWSGPPAWSHGDLSPGNVLVTGGRLSAVIDFSGVGVGDPTVDLSVAWNLLSASARERFRAALDVDDVTWLRGRAWALSIAVIQLPYYHRTNPVLAANARHVIREVLHSRGTSAGVLAEPNTRDISMA
jgi:aminoglycoside phosphotransferase (APT) family kinase protein